MTDNQIPDEQELRVVGRIAIGSRVWGRNHWTDEQISGEVTSLVRSGLDGRVYVEVVDPNRPRLTQRAVIDDIRLERIRCRRPTLIPDSRYTAGLPQGDGYRCAQCGWTIWFIRDGRAESGERLTHDAALAESPSHAF